MIPSQQHCHDDLPELSEEKLYWRRETVFLIMAGLFLGTLVMLNLLGITRFIDLSFTIPLLGWASLAFTVLISGQNWEETTGLMRARHGPLGRIETTLEGETS